MISHLSRAALVLGPLLAAAGCAPRQAPTPPAPAPALKAALTSIADPAAPIDRPDSLPARGAPGWDRGISRDVKETKGVGPKAHLGTSRPREHRLTQRAREMTGPDPALPGLGEGTPALVAALREALAAKPPSYRPRTRHLTPEGGPRFINRLIGEASPYLLQHAHNPVDWHPWGDAAFEQAERQNRPVLLSIGYSTCHWCHVMERESFEDLEIAEYINTHFVAIKVDREERPDIDAVYMRAVRLLTGRGGWPMTTALTPEREPFFGGTYFPARTGDRGSHKGLLTILRELAGEYARDPAAVVARAQVLSRKIAAAAAPHRPGAIPGREAISATIRAIAERYDPVWGGLGSAPKFPRPVTMSLLLRYHRWSGDAHALEMVTTTLEHMAAGGIHDQIGGGFHRYATDRRWLLPHFEKMLYDNAQLANLYLDAFQVTERADFAAIVTDILDYLAREMTAPTGALYSATDADSPAAEEGEGDQEGLFFTWTPAELDAALPAELARIARGYYGVTARGQLEGRSVLHRGRPDDEAAAALSLEPKALREALRQIRARLYAARAERRPPLRDEKLLTAWNGLAISAFARAGLVLARPDYIARAEAAARFVLERLTDASGRLLRSYRAGRGRLGAYLDDYAFFIEALLDLHEATGALRWLQRALALQALLDAHYADDEGGGWFATADDAEALLARDKPDYDGALPSGNSVALSNLLRLAELTGDERLRRRAEAGFGAFSSRLRRSGLAVPRMLSALDTYLDTMREIVIVRPAEGGDAEALLAVLRATYLPNRVLIQVTAPEVAAETEIIPLLLGKLPRGGRATAYVCERGRCERPTSDPATFAEQLK